jgi:hypothetical protein
MPHLNTMSRRPAAVLLALLAAGAVGSVGLAACGSSSSSTTTTTAANAAATGAAGTTAPGARGSRFAAMRECMRKNGVTLPQRRPGGGAGGFLGGGQGGPQLPSGVTPAQFLEALKKCGGDFRGGNHFRRNRPSPQALAQFAACMRQNGIDLPTANTSGKGPIFDTKGIDTTSPQFKAAAAKCRSVLFPGARPGGTAGGAAPNPPAGAGTEGTAG